MKFYGNEANAIVRALKKGIPEKNTKCPDCGSRDTKWTKEKSIWNQCNVCGTIFAADHKETDISNEGGRHT